MKKILIVSICFILSLILIGCEGKSDPRERELVVLTNENKFDEAIARANELYEGEDKKLNEVLKLIEDARKLRKGSQQPIQNTYPSDKLKIQSGYTYSVKDSYVYINGKVKNISGTEISYFEVVVDLMDSQGNIIHSEYTNDGLVLNKNAEREFEIMFKQNDNYKKYSLSIGKVK